MSKPDYVFIGLVVVLVVFGFFMLSSATAPYAINKFGDSYHYVKNQFLNGLILGVILFFLALRTDYRLLKKYSNYILLFSLALLALVFVPGIGVSYGKARSWISVFGIFSFQPAELAKLGLIIFLSAWLEYRMAAKNFTPADTLAKFLIILGIFCIPILLQPDMGTMSILVFIALLIYFVAGAPMLYLAGLGGALFGAFVMLIKIASYRMARFTAFLNPTADPQGAGYQISQALLAIGSGKFFGNGFWQSVQKFRYLPEVSADSIFAVIGEELGFFWSALLIVALIFLFIKGLKIAHRAPDAFGKFLAIGIVGWIVFQSFINIGAMLALVPLTGLPLPFISYGGTALAMTLAGAGILANISRWNYNTNN